MAKEKKHRYEKQQYPGLNSKYQVPNRRDLVEVDYLHKLNPEEMAWLDKFTQETVITNFDEDDSNNLIKGKAAKRRLYKENNDRNNDLYGNLKVTKRLLFQRPQEPTQENNTSGESKINDYAPSSVKETSSSNPEEDFALTRLALKDLSNQKKKTAKSS